MEPVIDTTLGRIRGLRTGAAVSYLGIRYGRADRFCAPTMAEPHAGTCDAVRHGPAAMQFVEASLKDDMLAWYSTVADTSEDCLFLNVFVPSEPASARPIMVWMHGGGWMNLAGAVPGTDGAALAAAENVVVVTLNHRIGAFGFVAVDGEDERYADAGNAGLLDIALALQWVRDNAKALGGDPDNVTIFGQSGGAAKVAALLNLPAAKGLFHKAIVQSLSGGLEIADRDEADRMARAVYDVAGVRPGDAAGLASLSAERFLEVQKTQPRTFRPVIDGRQFDRHPFVPDAPALASGIPVMAGCTDTETTYYLRHDPANFNIDESSLTRRLGRFLGLDPASVGRIVEGYRDAGGGQTPSEVLVAVTTDQIFKRNTYHIVQAQAAAGHPSYAYVFARNSPVMGGVLRAPHCSELPFIFGSTKIAEAMVGDAADIGWTTRMMMATWAAFARTGRPSNPMLPDWQDYGRSRSVMRLGPDPVVRDADGEAQRTLLEPLRRLDYTVDRKTFVTDTPKEE